MKGTTRLKIPLIGVHIGPVCIDGEPFTVTERGAPEGAHAHITDPKCRDPFLGWICAKDLSSLRVLLVHEIAHLAADAGHDDRWRRSVHRLGGRVTAAYRKRPRTKQP